MSVRAAAKVMGAPGLVRPNTGRDPTAGRVIEGGPHEFDVSSEPQGIVYALLDREVCHVKIGFTARRSVQARQREHERHRGRPLELLGVMRGGRSLERVMHARFAEYRAERREWF